MKNGDGVEEEAERGSEKETFADKLYGQRVKRLWGKQAAQQGHQDINLKQSMDCTCVKNSSTHLKSSLGEMALFVSGSMAYTIRSDLL